MNSTLKKLEGWWKFESGEMLGESTKPLHSHIGLFGKTHLEYIQGRGRHEMRLIPCDTQQDCFVFAFHETGSPLPERVIGAWSRVRVDHEKLVIYSSLYKKSYPKNLEDTDEVSVMRYLRDANFSPIWPAAPIFPDVEVSDVGTLRWVQSRELYKMEFKGVEILSPETGSEFLIQKTTRIVEEYESFFEKIEVLLEGLDAPFSLREPSLSVIWLAIDKTDFYVSFPAKDADHQIAVSFDEEGNPAGLDFC